MEVRQIRVSIETRGIMEKLRDTYCKERFNNEQVLIMPGYLLNAAYEETRQIEDWGKIIEQEVAVEEEFKARVTGTKTPIVRFKLSQNANEGLNCLTKKLSNDLQIRVQTGFAAKQILKAALLIREGK